jgi:STE24 endopeptidase
MRKLLFALAAAAVVTVAVAAIAQPKQESKPPQDDQRFEVRVTPEMLRHSRIENVLYVVAEVYGVAVLLVVLASGLSSRMRDAAFLITQKRFLAAMIYFGLFIIVTTLMSFPLDYYSGFVVPHQFDLSDQSFGSWMVDQLKGLGITLVIGSVLAALALFGIRKFKSWWRVLWIGSLPIILLLVVIAPVFLDPIFNEFTPLRDQSLKQALIEQGNRAGIRDADVLQADRSKQTKTMNAYVTGVGPTKRMVIWDTLLAKMNRQEVLAVMGHETGHYVLNHIWKGLAFTVFVALVIFYVGQQLYDRGLARWGRRWGIREAGDPAALPWLLLLTGVISFFLSPVTSGFSRHLEHEADLFGLELTHDNEPMATALKKLAEDSKEEPEPNAFIEWWTYSHPSINKRIRFVLNYKPWEKGQPNQAFRPR